MRINRVTILSTFCLLLTVTLAVQAQGICSALVEQAIAAMGENCGGVDRNNACYGFNLVDASFVEEVSDEFFNTPSDKAELAELQTIQTAALDLTTEQWGIAVMNVQANVPGTLPGQAVTFILVGDAEVENQVSADEVTSEVIPVTITTTSDFDLRSGPGTNFNAVGTAATGTELQADALSADGEWARVAFDDRIAWIALDSIDASAELGDLPASSEPVRSPMQAFYFSGGVGTPQCNEAPNALTIRSPENISINLTVNGANIVVGSQIIVQQITGNAFSITTEEGTIYAIDPSLEVTPEQIAEFMQLLDAGVLPEIEDGRFSALGGAITGFVVPAGQSIVGLSNQNDTIFQWQQPTDSTDEQESIGDFSSQFFETLDEEDTEVVETEEATEEVQSTEEPTEEVIAITPTRVTRTPTPTPEATEIVERTRNPNIITDYFGGSAPPPGVTVPAGPPFVAYWNNCTVYTGEIVYQDAPLGTTSLTISWVDEIMYPRMTTSPVIVSVPPSSGVFVLAGGGPSTLTNGMVTANPSGISYPLAGSCP